MDDRDTMAEIFERHTGVALDSLSRCEKRFPGWGVCGRVAGCDTPGCPLSEKSPDRK